MRTWHIFQLWLASPVNPTLLTRPVYVERATKGKLSTAGSNDELAGLYGRGCGVRSRSTSRPAVGSGLAQKQREAMPPRTLRVVIKKFTVLHTSKLVATTCQMTSLSTTSVASGPVLIQAIWRQSLPVSIGNVDLAGVFRAAMTLPSSTVNRSKAKGGSALSADNVDERRRADSQSGRGA